MAQMLSFFAAALVFLAYEGVLVDAVCPASQQEAEAAAKQCLKRIGLDIDAAGAGGAMANNDLGQLEQYCNDGTLDNALGCAEEIVEDCKAQSEKVAEALTKAISISKLRSGFKYLCDNINVLKDNGQCIADQIGEVATCVQVETKRFQAELTALQESGKASQEDVMRISCGFMDRIFMCQHTIYKEKCGKEIADVMTTFMQSAKPPMCADYSGATAVSVSWTLLACLFGLFVYLRE